MLECVHILRVGFPVSLTWAEAVDLLRPLAAQAGAAQAGAAQAGAAQAGAAHPPSPKLSSAKLSSAKLSSAELGSAKLGSANAEAGVAVDERPASAPAASAPAASAPAAAVAIEPWLHPLLSLEVAAARRHLPPDSAEHACAQPWAFGKSKLFMRGFLFTHIGRRRELARDRAARRLQRRQRHRAGLRFAARSQLELLMSEGSAEQLSRVLPR